MFDFQWLPLTWDAVAVFVTGVAAMIGATIIGRKQAAIAELQANIQKMQVENDSKLRSNSLKLELMEKRSEIIGRLREIYLAFNANVELSNEERQKLGQTIQNAELIFQADVIEGLREISSKAYRLRFKNLAANRAYSKNDTAKGDEFLDEAIAIENEIFERLPALIDSMIEHSRLHDVS